MQRASTHNRRGLLSSSHQGNPNKTPLRYLRTHIKRVKIKKTDNNKSWQGYEATGIFIFCCFINWHKLLENSLVA